MTSQKAQDEVQDFLKSGRKLNEFVEEDIDVTVITPVVDEKNQKVTFKTDVEKRKQKVFYASSPPRRVICTSHWYLPEDPKRYIFKCKNCDYHYKGLAITHKYVPETGKLIYRKTGKEVV